MSTSYTEAVEAEKGLGYALGRTIPAVVLAGTDYDRSKLIEGKNKNLLNINGKCVFQYVVEELEQSSRIDDISIVGPKKQLEDKVKNHILVPESTKESGRERFIENMANGYDALESDGYALFIGGDIPFATHEAIDDFIKQCSLDKNADFYYAVMQQTAGGHPLQPYREPVRLVEGGYRAANIGLADPSKIRHKKLIGTGFKFRKLRSRLNVLNLFLHVSPWFFFRWSLSKLKITHQLRLLDYEKEISKALDTRFKLIETKYSGLEWDLDEDVDYTLMNDIISRGKRDMFREPVD